MPTYHYRCQKCAHEFEEFQSIIDEALTICPECQGPVLRLISGGAGLIFKGSGFYITDYKRKGSSESSGKSDSKSEPKSESKSESKSETKSDNKGESKGGSSGKDS